MPLAGGMRESVTYTLRWPDTNKVARSMNLGHLAKSITGANVMFVRIRPAQGRSPAYRLRAF